MTIRRAAVAGAFYPADAGRLADLVDRLLENAPATHSGSRPAALIVPHAGYLYSGAVAAAAYRRIAAGADSIRRVVVVGPAHYIPLDGAAVPAADAWATPLGSVAIGTPLREAALAAGAVADDRPHAPEHSIEVQLPFLQRLLGDELSLLPLAVGGLEPGSLADLLARLRAEADLLVVSTDLSHDHPEDVARDVDRRTVEAIVEREPDALGWGAACGIVGLRGVVELARREGLAVSVLDQRTSADAGGDRGRVVGYAALSIG